MNRLLGILASLVLAVTALTVAAPEARADANYANIGSDYRSVDALKVCRDWGTTTCASGTGYLNARETTKAKFGWADADGIYVAGDQRVTSGVYSWTGPRWVKIAGCGGCLKVFRVYWR